MESGFGEYLNSELHGISARFYVDQNAQLITDKASIVLTPHYKKYLHGTNGISVLWI